MAWDNEYYLYMVETFRKDIKPGEEKKWFGMFDKMIEQQDYEAAKAIKDVMVKIAEDIKKTRNIIDKY